jgi:hypothetical protein
MLFLKGVINMKKFTLQLQDTYGKIETESEVTIGENDVLIMQFPEEMRLDHASQYFNLLKNGIENGGAVGLPNTITFMIIKNN